jgi:hypothetical protein
MVKKVLGCSAVAGGLAGKGQTLSGQLERPTVEGSPGAAELILFRERIGEAALQGK